MAKHLDKFTQPFRDSPIPFALAEILTNGSGEMVDLVCRFLNPAAAALLGLSPEEVQGRRLSQLGPERALEQLAPMQAVAFSGSSASFPYDRRGPNPHRYLLSGDVRHRGAPSGSSGVR